MPTTTSYDAVGSAASPSTLTAAYTGNTFYTVAEYLPNINIKGTYTPKTGQTDRYISILIESSDDASNFYERSNYTNTTTQTKIYEDAEFIFPGSGSSTGGTAYDFNFSDATVSGKYVKISIKEDGSGNFGTVYARLTLSNPN